MAVDTRNKRSSAIGAGRGWLIRVPEPDGTIDAQDRKHVGHTYAGLVAAPPIIDTPGSSDIGISGAEVDITCGGATVGIDIKP